MRCKFLCNVIIALVTLCAVWSNGYADKEYTVNADGSFVYRVNIEVPPGRQGVQPDLALVYNSNAPEGMIGYGWILSGLPGMSRDPLFAIDYDGHDHYRGPEGRLVKIDTEENLYHYQEDTFSLFQPVGSQGDGPEYWLEIRPDGTKYYYGCTTDARAEAVNYAPSVREWSLCKVEDVHGNYYTIEYISDNGLLYPKKIAYTLGPDSDDGHVIEFFYKNRSDYDTNSYLFRSRTKQALLLEHIVIKTGGTLLERSIRTYTLNYSDDRDGHPYLKNIDVREDATDKTQRIAFEWGDDTRGFQNMGSILNAYGSWYEATSRTYKIDVNGDGLRDIVLGPNGSGNWYVLRNTGNGFVNAGAWITGAYGNWDEAGSRIRAMDVNGDGLQDIVIGPDSKGRWYVLKSTGHSFTNSGAWISGAYGDFDGAVDRIRPMDVNGDGLQDIVIGPDSKGRWYVLKSTGYSFTNSGLWITGAYGNWDGAGSRIRPMDVNGDGLDDIVLGPSSSGYWYVLKSTGHSFTNLGTWIGGVYGDFDGAADRIRPMDVNGDGLSDIVLGPRSTGNWYVLKNTGHRFIDEGPWITGAYGNWDGAGSRIRPMDVSGDGLQDMVLGPNSSGYWYVLYNRGGHFTDGGTWLTGSYGNWDNAASRISPMDVTGDGFSDIVLGPNCDGYWYLIKNKQSLAYRKLVGITNSVAKSITIRYESSHHMSGAIDSSDIKYPLIADTAPRKLVANVTVSDGRENDYSTSYEYRKAMKIAGYSWERKSMGFAEFTEINETTGIRTITTYLQDSSRPEMEKKPEVVTVKDADGNIVSKTTYTYYEDNRTSYQYTDPSGITTYTTHVKPESVVTEKYEGSDNTTLVATQIQSFDEYDEYGNILKVTDRTVPATHTIITEMTYDVNETSDTWIVNRPASIRKTDGKDNILEWQQFSYYNNKLVTKEAYLDAESGWIATKYGYDEYGNVTSITDAMNNTITMSYDSEYSTYLVRETNALGFTTTATYDAGLGRLIAKEDANGNTTSYEYDGFGRLVMVVEPADEWTQKIEYNDTGDATTQYVKTTYKTGNSETYKINYFDGLGRTYKTVQKAYRGGSHQLEIISEKEYGDYDRVAWQHEPYIIDNNETVEDILTTGYTYDARGRLTEICYGDGRKKSYAYGTEIGGDTSITASVTITDIDNKIYKNFYDARGLLYKKEEPGGASIEYGYDAKGRLVEVKDHDELTTSIRYDSLGRKTEFTDPNMGRWLYAYYATGQLKTQTDAKGQTTTYFYDAAHRISLIDYSDDTPDVEYHYDDSIAANGTGRLTSVNDGVSETSFSYTAKGQVAVKKHSIDDKTFVFTMDYDEQKRLVALTYPDGTTITREYADSGYLKKVAWGGSPLVRYGRFETDENGDVLSFAPKVYRITGNNVKTSIAYNTLTRLPESVLTTHVNEGDTTVLEHMEYTFDGGRRIQSIADLDTSDGFNASQEFAYDQFNRLKSATSSSDYYGTILYDYDANGNLTRKGDLELGYTDTEKHPHAVTSINNTLTYAYDNNGNMIQRNEKLLRYDAKNRLLAIEHDGNTEVSYYYDFTGHRIKKCTSDGTTIYNFSNLYEYASVPGREDHYTKYFHGAENELVSQVTRINSTLMGMSVPQVIKRYYNFNSLKGLFVAGYQYLNYASSSLRMYHYLLQGILVLLLLVTVGLIVYNMPFSNRMRFWRYHKRPDWVHRFSPVILFVVIVVFGMSGCELPYMTPGSAPWDSLEAPSTITTENLPVEGIYFFHPDYTSNISYLTDKNGKKVHQLYYKPYGEIVRHSGDDVHRYKFNAHQFDGESGLHYYKSRYYDPGIGRFLTPDNMVPDPEKSQSLNRYAYVEGSPIELRDMNGHFSVKALYKRIKENISDNSDSLIAVCAVVASIYLGPVSGVGFALGGTDLKPWEMDNWKNFNFENGVKGIVVANAIGGSAVLIGQGVAAGYGGTILASAVAGAVSSGYGYWREKRQNGEGGNVFREGDFWKTVAIGAYFGAAQGAAIGLVGAGMGPNNSLTALGVTKTLGTGAAVGFSKSVTTQILTGDGNVELGRLAWDTGSGLVAAGAGSLLDAHAAYYAPQYGLSTSEAQEILTLELLGLYVVFYEAGNVYLR